jgi:hypothetical protein
LGNGGFVETSGHLLDFAGARVDTSAPYGHIGQWLLDPATLVIDTSLANTVSSNLAATSVTLSADIDLYLTANITKSAGSDATLTFIAPFIYQYEGTSIISTAGKLNIDYEASDLVWFGRGWLGAESTIITNGGNVTFHGTHFVGVNGTINAGYGQVLIRSENPTGFPFDSDQGIYLFGNTTITGSKITLNSPILRIDPGVRQIIQTPPPTTLPPPQNQINPTQPTQTGVPTPPAGTGFLSLHPNELLTWPAIEGIVEAGLSQFVKFLPADLSATFKTDLASRMQNVLGSSNLTIATGGLTIVGIALSDIASIYIDKMTDRAMSNCGGGLGYAVVMGTGRYELQVAANAAIDYVTTPSLWKLGLPGVEAAVGAGVVQSTAGNLIDLFRYPW